MKLLFFQNCVSPHQIPYIRELVNSFTIEEVVLIVPRYDSDERRKMGWRGKVLLENAGIHFVFSPHDDEVKKLLECSKSSCCLFSGIRADRDVFRWLKLSLNYSVKRYIITEAPFVYRKPLWMHYIRFYLQDYKYVSKIDGIFAIGDDAERYYKKISQKWKVFPFQYVTEDVQRTQSVPQGSLKLLFVGNLCKRKNVQIVIRALKGIDSVEFTVIGDGIERKNLERLSQKMKIEVNFLGTKEMKAISHIMQSYDVLVLPSLYDGWGAVVNEAMGLGLYVIVSDRCGAKQLIDNESVGLIVKSNSVLSVKKALIYCVENLEVIRCNSKKNIKYFEQNRAKNIAKYFVDCITK